MNGNTISEIELKYSPANPKIGRVKISDSKSAYKILLETWNKETIELYEEFKILLLNKANEVLGIYVVSKGGITGTVVDIKLLFAVVLKSASTGIILAHNHPSGNLRPSEADKTVFGKIKIAANYLDINVFDNLILSKDGYCSFTNQGIE